MAEFSEENEQQGNHVYDDYGDEQEDEIEIEGDTGAMLVMECAKLMNGEDW